MVTRKISKTYKTTRKNSCGSGGKFVISLVIIFIVFGCRTNEKEEMMIKQYLIDERIMSNKIVENAINLNINNLSHVTLRKNDYISEDLEFEFEVNLKDTVYSVLGKIILLNNKIEFSKPIIKRKNNLGFEEISIQEEVKVKSLIRKINRSSKFYIIIEQMIGSKYRWVEFREKEVILSLMNSPPEDKYRKTVEAILYSESKTDGSFSYIEDLGNDFYFVYRVITSSLL